jgi:hypothetical protein
MFKICVSNTLLRAVNQYPTAYSSLACLSFLLVTKKCFVNVSFRTFRSEEFGMFKDQLFDLKLIVKINIKFKKLIIK